MVLTEPPLLLNTLDENTNITSNESNTEQIFNENVTASNMKTENLFIHDFWQNVSIASNSQLIDKEEVIDSELTKESHENSDIFKTTLSYKEFSTIPHFSSNSSIDSGSKSKEDDVNDAVINKSDEEHEIIRITTPNQDLYTFLSTNENDGIFQIVATDKTMMSTESTDLGSICYKVTQIKKDTCILLNNISLVFNHSFRVAEIVPWPRVSKRE